MNAWIALASAPLFPPCPPPPGYFGCSEAHALSAFCVAASGEAPPNPPKPPPNPPPKPPLGRPLGRLLGRVPPEGRLKVGRLTPCCDRHCRYASMACELPRPVAPEADVEALLAEAPI